jgi:hypothetical protein
VRQQLGLWRVPRTVYHLPTLSTWDAAPEAAAKRELAGHRFTFGGQPFVFALEARREPWRHAVATAQGYVGAGGPNCGACRAAGGGAGASWGGEDANGFVTGWDAELVPVLRRAVPAHPDGGSGGSGPMNLVAIVEFIDRWSGWMRVPLSAGEEIVFDLADRRSLGTVCERAESQPKCRLLLLAGHAAAATRAHLGGM